MKYLLLIFSLLLCLNFSISYDYYYDHKNDTNFTLSWINDGMPFLDGWVDDSSSCLGKRCSHGVCFDMNIREGKKNYCGCDRGYFGHDCAHTQPILISFIPADISGGEVLFNGYFIDHILYKISIGNNSCEILASNETTIICNLSKLENYEPHQLNITQGLITLITEYRPTPMCKNNGMLMDNKTCQCELDWEGYDCSLPKQISYYETLIRADYEGGFIRLKGYFGNEANKLKVIIDNYNIINISSINSTILEGFVKKDINFFHGSFFKKISIYNEKDQLLSEAKDDFFVYNRCNHEISDKEVYDCLCLKNIDKKCERYKNK